MAINLSAYQALKTTCTASAAKLVAVSKTKPVEDILALYSLGQRDFGENYVQELVDKQAGLPEDIRWHFIGHLQSNKVKFIAPFVHLIHGVDSFKLLREINKQGAKADRVIACLLQVHIAREETKFGFDEAELADCLSIVQKEPDQFTYVKVAGLMGMASFSDDSGLVRQEFRQLKQLFDKSGFHREIHTLSMGMSGDYPIALEEGSNLIRIGSLLFGARS
ncbi:YggS family pyridoxal phosphate-dependent enzyme [Flavihumibacter profundi]|uniref:YggS family pyridoxal phosphate-dependent enzyme n=1 Tax=Flavihumibacter profundi TaxID=2716883 RepID=UPI001CC44B6D|nr:YggS family pyridoxal phosphate-dependent enzyme [Flavihumibacter profundi]MBZ5855740.1 YggS family pyridoxal phosphate-dependent enzyme [Flavihumibacter profundi]